MAETISILISSSFDLFDDYFGGVPIAMGNVLKSEAVAVERGLEPTRRSREITCRQRRVSRGIRAKTVR